MAPPGGKLIFCFIEASLHILRYHMQKFSISLSEKRSFAKLEGIRLIDNIISYQLPIRRKIEKI